MQTCVEDISKSMDHRPLIHLKGYYLGFYLIAVPGWALVVLLMPLLLFILRIVGQWKRSLLNYHVSLGQLKFFHLCRVLLKCGSHFLHISFIMIFP